MTIPSFDCKPGCHACCGIVPFSTTERDRVAAIRPMEQWEPFMEGAWIPAGALASFKCPFLGTDGCTIYEHRPAVCQLFGSVDHPRMKCPMGCGPKRLMTDAESREIIRKAA